LPIYSPPLFVYHAGIYISHASLFKTVNLLQAKIISFSATLDSLAKTRKYDGKEKSSSSRRANLVE